MTVVQTTVPAAAALVGGVGGVANHGAGDRGAGRPPTWYSLFGDTCDTEEEWEDRTE